LQEKHALKSLQTHRSKMSSSQPGKKARGSNTGSSLNALFDILGQRWALGILWYLDDGPVHLENYKTAVVGYLLLFLIVG
jgi:hypothetical protein